MWATSNSGPTRPWGHGTRNEDALYRSKTEKGVMNQTNKKNQQRLNDLIAINMKSDQELAEFGKWTRRKVETMILVDVHARDVMIRLTKEKVSDISDFTWTSQLRYYWREEDGREDLFAQMVAGAGISS